MFVLSGNRTIPVYGFAKFTHVAPIYSARINMDYRVVGVRDADSIVWFWIGSHTDYDHLLSQL
jgi:hypothetical protein